MLDQATNDIQCPQTDLKLELLWCMVLDGFGNPGHLVGTEFSGASWNRFG